MTVPSPVPRTVRGAAGCALVFAVLTVIVGFGPGRLVVSVDGAVARSVLSALTGHSGVQQLLRVVTWAGHPLVVDAIVLLGAVVLWSRRRPGAAVSLVVTGLVSLLVRDLVKTLIDRPRPLGGFSVATGGSYPSGHTAGAAFVAVAAIVLVRRAWVAVSTAVYALAVGTTRILLDVHWLSDVVAGLLLGATFGLLIPWAQTQIGERLRVETLPDR